MKIKFVFVMLAALLCTCSLSSCVFISGDFRRTKNMIISELGPVNVDTEIQLRIGTGLISFITSFTGRDKDALTYLHDLKKIQVGAYRLYSVNRNQPIVIPKKIAKHLSRKGYEPIVKVKDRDKVVCVMTRFHSKRLRSLYVIALERDELVLIEIRGRLGKLIENVIREHGF